MKNEKFVVKTYSQEQTKIVFDFLKKKGYRDFIKPFTLKRYVGSNGSNIVHSNECPTEKNDWNRYKEITVDELFRMLKKKKKKKKKKKFMN